jgi:NAD(P) transhydrogenase subunit alpha
MNLAVPKEVHPGEVRVALIPDHVAKLVNAGAEVAIESGLGQPLRITDEKYTEAGASIVADHNQLLQNADVVLRIRKPLAEEVDQMKPSCIYISLLDPFNERELIDMFVAKNISAISMEMIPRITRAQKMDVLSSQANLAGYVAVMSMARLMIRRRNQLLVEFREQIEAEKARKQAEQKRQEAEQAERERAEEAERMRNAA